ncbi:glycosyltransferase [Aphelenchoides avenae]|nr:glycosyltransferase [Aphelenchus avenae]
MAKKSRLFIAIVASERPGHYLTSVVAGLGQVYSVAAPSASLHVDEFARPSIAICNTADGHFEELRLVETKLEVIEINRDGRLIITDFDARLRKEADDYWRCLDAASKYTAADYVLLLEDDALPTSSFPVVLKSLTEQLDRRPHIDFVKFYHPWSLRKIPAFIQAAVFCATVSWCLHWALWKQSSVVATVIVAVLSFEVVRRSMPELFADMRFAITSSAYLTPPESCCTPAVLFRSASVPAIVAELSQETARGGHAKDHILDESRFYGRATDANAVAHIGRLSSLRQKMRKRLEDRRMRLRKFTMRL